MNTGEVHTLYKEGAGTMAYVAAQSADGSFSVGSAFHVGEGVFVTARHVVEKVRIIEVAMTERTYVPLEGSEAAATREFVRQGDQDVPVHYVRNGILTIDSGPHFHPNPAVDVAVFKVGHLDEHTPYVMLGDHLDDWIGASDFL